MEYLAFLIVGILIGYKLKKDDSIIEYINPRDIELGTPIKVYRQI